MAGGRARAKGWARRRGAMRRTSAHALRCVLFSLALRAAVSTLRICSCRIDLSQTTVLHCAPRSRRRNPLVCQREGCGSSSLLFVREGCGTVLPIITSCIDQTSPLLCNLFGSPVRAFFSLPVRAGPHTDREKLPTQARGPSRPHTEKFIIIVLESVSPKMQFQCIEVHYDRKSETRVPSHRNYPTKSQPFSIVWQDGADSVVDRLRLAPPPLSGGACALGAVVSTGAAAPSQ